MKKAFGIDNIKELAENKYVPIVQTTVAMASVLRILRAAGALQKPRESSARKKKATRKEKEFA